MISCLRGFNNDSLSNESTRECDSLIKTRISAWVETMVVGLGLCPFAEAVWNEQSVRIIVSRASTEEQMIQEMSEELDHIIRTDLNTVSTTLVIFPNFAYDDFLRFLDVCLFLDDQIEENESLVDKVMLAYFHPQYTWADAKSEDDAVNFDKRSPYPVVNILRAPQVDQYVAEGRTQGIVDRNRQILEKMGSDRIRHLFKSL